MCKKQTSVSQSSAESDIISLDAALRVDGLSALDLWCMVNEVLRSLTTQSKPNHGSIRETKTPNDKRMQKIDQLSDVDYVHTNTHSSQGESQSYTP